MPRWVLAPKLMEMFGYTKDQINGKVRDGVWAQGIHWKLGPDGRRYYNWQVIDQWIDAA